MLPFGGGGGESVPLPPLLQRVNHMPPARTTKSKANFAGEQITFVMPSCLWRFQKKSGSISTDGVAQSWTGWCIIMPTSKNWNQQSFSQRTCYNLLFAI